MSFNQLGLNSELLPVIQQHYSEAYPIQTEIIPTILKGKDVLGIAKTGSGKTAGYVLPILSVLANKKAPINRLIKVLVLVPTRELAVQVSAVFSLFEKAFSHPIKTYAAYGGVSINPQMMAMNGVSVLIATPGRLLELVDSNAVHLAEVQTLVLDEADKLLNPGFKLEMGRIFSLLPKKRQSILFSATLSTELSSFTDLVLKDPSVVKIETNEDDIELINQTAYAVSEERKGPFLRFLIRDKIMEQVLVFVSSIQRADRVADKLRKNGIDALAIHSEKSQHTRTESLHQFKKGKIPVLVTTDLLARGIDIEFLPFVVNYELPRSPKDFIHRIGRTGRAEHTGEAITLLTPEEEAHFEVICKKMKKNVEIIDTENIDLHGY